MKKGVELHKGAITRYIIEPVLMRHFKEDPDRNLPVQDNIYRVAQRVKVHYFPKNRSRLKQKKLPVDVREKENEEEKVQRESKRDSWDFKGAPKPSIIPEPDLRPKKYCRHN